MTIYAGLFIPLLILVTILLIIAVVARGLARVIRGIKP